MIDQSKERLNDYLKQWLRTIKSLKITLLSEGILNYELERTDDEEYTESGIITPELTEAIIGREENEFYVKVVRKVMDNVKKELVKALKEIGEAIKADLIAEGIEKEEKIKFIPFFISFKKKNIPNMKKNKAKFASKAIRENCKCQGEMASSKAAAKPTRLSLTSQ